MARVFNRACGWVLSGLLSLGAAQNAAACAFHGYTPDPTLVDILLGTEQVVIARLDPSDPSRYAPVEALMGPDALDLPLAVGAETRAKLLGRPAATVLLARDGAYGPWLELAVLDDRYREVVDQILQRQSAWILGGDEERLQLFAGLLNDPNPDLRRLALRELDRADYSVLQDVRLPRINDLRQDLESGDADMAPIRVLLAGLSRDPSFGGYLSEELDAAVGRALPYMGAYATAMIELEGETAVRTIMERHLMTKSLSVGTREKLLEAFAIQHQTAPRSTRRAIARGVAELLRHSPELAGATARQFGFRSDWSMAKPIARARIAHPPTAIQDIFAVNQYIDLSKAPLIDR